MKLCLYSGAGNTFVVLDGRETLPGLDVEGLCSRYGTDGLMVLRTASDCDFEMDYYNSDGSGGMMCGNGGRCIVAFADHLGIRPADGKVYSFRAADGMHTGEVLDRDGEQKTVRLRMIDVTEFHPALDGWFLDTGTRHFVKFVPDVESLDIQQEGRRYRWAPEFAPVGANANFVQVADVLKVRTFEKGVEDETQACGTGITASALAASLTGVAPNSVDKDGRKHYSIRARRDDLSVDFLQGAKVFTSVYLTGPTTLTSEYR
ncbi:MAG: diaminopimelate epimerase [Candidatus Cryptobacteroides sp.]